MLTPEQILSARASYTTKKNSAYWQGAIRVEKTVVWTCEHAHHNRDQSSTTNGTCAVECAKRVLFALQRRDQFIAWAAHVGGMDWALAAADGLR